MPRLSHSLSVLALSVLVTCPTIAQVRPSEQRKGLKFKIYLPLVFKGRTVSGSIRQSEIAGLLDLPVRNGDTGPSDSYGVEMTMPNHKKIMTYTCLQWEKARAVGAYSATTYDMTMEGFFIQTCGILYEVQNAKLPVKNFLENPRVSLFNLNLLPADILSTWTDAERKLLRGKTVAEVVPSKDVTKEKDGTLTLSYGNLRQSFWEAARADFNGDGIEDILVCTFGRAEGGTMNYSDYLVLTRLSPSGPLKLIHTKEPWQKADQ